MRYGTYYILVLVSILLGNYASFGYRKISGYFRPMLILQWDNLAIKNKLSEKQIELKSTISLSYWQAYKLRKILNQTFCAYLILIHDNYITTHYQTEIISLVLIMALCNTVYKNINLYICWFVVFFPRFCAFFFYFLCQRACKGLMLETWL